jgi:hypothetical protein
MGNYNIIEPRLVKDNTVSLYSLYTEMMKILKQFLDRIQCNGLFLSCKQWFVASEREVQ